MPTRSEMKELKVAWRLITQYQSDPPWYTFLDALQKNLLLSESHKQNVQTVQKMARIHRDIPKTGVPLSECITYFLRIEETIKNMNGRSLLGSELEKLIQEQNIPLPHSTRASWFSQIGGFSKKRLYTPEQISYILFRCAVYKGKSIKKDNAHI